MARMPTTSRMLSTILLSSVHVRGYSMLYGYRTRIICRDHGLGLILHISYTSTVSCDNTSGNVVDWMEYIVLQGEPIPSHFIPPIGRWHTMPNNFFNDVLYFLMSFGCRGFWCRRSLHGMVLSCLYCLVHCVYTSCNGHLVYRDGIIKLVAFQINSMKMTGGSSKSRVFLGCSLFDVPVVPGGAIKKKLYFLVSTSVEFKFGETFLLPSLRYLASWVRLHLSSFEAV